jgi:heme/copper-type cytochrome/quinol oxidase subunit 1
MRLFFTIATSFIAVPDRHQVLQLAGHHLEAARSPSTAPMLFSCAFIVNFVFGGITGVALGPGAVRHPRARHLLRGRRTSTTSSMAARCL